MSTFQDGTQKFGIPASPITVNSVVYIAEDISINYPANVVEIKNPDGTPQGQAIIPGNPTGTAKLQFATATTAIPTSGQSFTLTSVVYYVTTVGEKYTQGGYAYCDISFVKKIN